MNKDDIIEEGTFYYHFPELQITKSFNIGEYHFDFLPYEYITEVLGEETIRQNYYEDTNPVFAIKNFSIKAMQNPNSMEYLFSGFISDDFFDDINNQITLIYYAILLVTKKNYSMPNNSSKYILFNNRIERLYGCYGKTFLSNGGKSHCLTIEEQSKVSLMYNTLKQYYNSNDKIFSLLKVLSYNFSNKINDIYIHLPQIVVLKQYLIGLKNDSIIDQIIKILYKILGDEYSLKDYKLEKIIRGLYGFRSDMLHGRLLNEEKYIKYTDIIGVLFCEITLKIIDITIKYDNKLGKFESVYDYLLRMGII